MSLVTEFIDGLFEAPQLFADVATNDPLAALLLAIGALLTFLSVAVFGGLVLGAVVNLLTGGQSAEPREPMR